MKVKESKLLNRLLDGADESMLCTAADGWLHGNNNQREWFDVGVRIGALASKHGAPIYAVKMREKWTALFVGRVRDIVKRIKPFLIYEI